MFDVSIVQPYVPAYRVALFDRLHQRLSATGLSSQVVAPEVRGDQAGRRDSTSSDHAWLTTTRGSRTFNLYFASLVYLGSLSHIQNSRAVILPLWATLLDTQYALWHPRLSRTRIGLWGHVDAYVKPANAIDVAIERRMMARADHIFAYTRRGGEFAAKAGVPPVQTTVLNNTVDTAQLRSTMQTLTEESIAQFCSKHGIDPQYTFSYVGGLDADKRIHFLAEVMEELHSIAPHYKLLVAGRGVDEHLLDTASRRGQVIKVGYADDTLKALMGRVSVALLNPGRIGLIAVDALAMGRPIVTTDYPFHAPEADYLVDGREVFRVGGDAREYAHYIAGRQFHEIGREPPSMGEMVARFSSGIMRMLDAPARNV